MKYIITRSSAWDEKPIESATTAQVHFYSYRYTSIKHNPNLWNEFISKHHDIKTSIVRGTENLPSDVWVAEVDDLHEFVRIYGTIILKEADNEEGLWTIEIYDDYRE